MAVEPVAHADTGAKFCPLIPSWIAIWPLAVSTRTEGMKNGETRSKPRSTNVCCCSAIVAMPADRRADEDPDPRRVDAVQARVVPGLLRRGDGEEDVAVHPPRLLPRDELADLEPTHLRRDPHGVLGGVERLDPADAAPAGHRRIPGGRRVQADRGDGPQAGDGDPPHGAESLLGRVALPRATLAQP